MVESEGGDGVPAEPIGLIRVGIGLNLREFDEGILGDGDDAFAGVAIDLAVGAGFLEVLDRQFQAGFLLQLPLGGVGDGFPPSTPAGRCRRWSCPARHP